MAVSFKCVSTSIISPQQLEEQLNALSTEGFDWCGSVTFKSTPQGGPYSVVIMRKAPA